MWLDISRVIKCARLAADVGWPEPAAVVMSSANLINAIAFACTEATKAVSCPSPWCRVPRRAFQYLKEQPCLDDVPGATSCVVRCLLRLRCKAYARVGSPIRCGRCKGNGVAAHRSVRDIANPLPTHRDSSDSCSTIMIGNFS